jgi:hypothetical protein
MFSPLSRYHGLEALKMETREGKEIAYVERRFLPSSDRFELLQEHLVMKGERLDNITAQYMGDPEQFWRICDANDAMHPDDLTEREGRRIRITLPEGIPGAQPNA